MSKDLTYTELLSKLMEIGRHHRFLLSCIEKMVSPSSLSTTSKTGPELPKSYQLKKVGITLDKIQYIKRIEDNTYSIKFIDDDFPHRVNESWIAVSCFKYVSDEDD